MNSMIDTPCAVAEKEQTDMAAGKRILFVCTGNTCRSPMAAAVYNARYAQDGSRAFSAGLAADGCCISPNAVSALEKAGIRSTPDNPYLCHVSHTVTGADMALASLVVAMTGEHAMRLLFAFPMCATKITMMADEIPDPYGRNVAAYEHCLVAIENALAKMFAADTESKWHRET